MHAPMQRMSLQPVTTNSTPVLDSWMPNDDPQFVGADESLQLLSQQLFLATWLHMAQKEVEPEIEPKDEDDTEVED